MVGPLAAQGDEARCSYPLMGALTFFYCNTFPKTDSNSLFLTSAGRAHPTYCSVEVQGGRVCLLSRSHSWISVSPCLLCPWLQVNLCQNYEKRPFYLEIIMIH